MQALCLNETTAVEVLQLNPRLIGIVRHSDALPCTQQTRSNVSELGPALLPATQSETWLVHEQVCEPHLKQPIRMNSLPISLGWLYNHGATTRGRQNEFNHFFIILGRCLVTFSDAFVTLL